MIQKNITYSIQLFPNSQNMETFIPSTKISLSVQDSTEKSMYLIHRALKQQLSTKKYRNAHTKTRSEVRGGGKKPWKQKGTGRARAGSTRSPLWRGGGVIFGPRHKITQNKINRKEKKLAIRTLIYNKSPHTTVVNSFLINENQGKPKSKLLVNQLKNLGFDLNKHKILIIVDKKNDQLYRSARNFQNLELINANHINVLSLLKCEKILITYEALNIIHNTYQ